MSLVGPIAVRLQLPCGLHLALPRLSRAYLTIRSVNGRRYVMHRQSRRPTSLTREPQALLSVLPDPVPVFHLGMYREKTTLQPVEYYNNLPYHSATTASKQTTPSDLAILLDPIIATGATASAAIDTLKDWGVKRIVICSVLASHEGLEKVSRVWEEGVQIWVGAVDPGTDAKGMIKPGLGDVGDRLFLTIGK